ncbi:MAG TPA: serine hydrolase [Caulobacteraceae bacterium]|jgi:CubicO group peptidase (beta-lactamase class C family)
MRPDLLKRAVAALAGAVLAAAALPALAAPPPDLHAYVEALRTQYGIPGMAVAVVEHGQTSFQSGFGVRKLGSPEPVDVKTIFPTGSTGKAFTTAALATLVDAGKLGWDDRVVDRLPGFQMYDPWVTREMTIRDLLVHRSGLGLGEGDLLFAPSSDYTRAETVRKLRFLKPATSFRSGYAYDNVLYAVAGQLIEAVTGQTWEDYVREHVLKPARMNDTTSDHAHRFADPDRAWPHARIDGPMRGLGTQVVLGERDGLGTNVSPAGGVSASAEDMAQWLKIQLAHGAVPGGGRLFSEASSAAMWKPETIIPTNPAPAPVTAASSQYESYALGWFVRDYRGHQIITHDGADLGFRATVVLIPEKDVGFAILSNAEDGVPLVATMYHLMDYYLGLPQIDWAKAWGEYKTRQVAGAMAALKAQTGAPAKVGPSLPLAAYAGEYRDPWYGPISIKPQDGKLTIDFEHSPGMVGELAHFQYDTFITRWKDTGIEPAYVTFALTPDGKVASAKLKPVSPLADFSFDYQDLALTPVHAGGGQ